MCQTPPFPPQAACVIAIHPIDGRILAATRRGTTDDWGIVGGKVDQGESTIVAAIREFREETGYWLIDIPDFLGTFVDEEGWHVHVFIVTQSIDYNRIAEMYDPGPREVEPGITVGYVPFPELMVKTFAKFNTDLIGPLLAHLL
jgi:8-oxo-dGTP pyrophosphatase MutT (NUDIX family)